MLLFLPNGQIATISSAIVVAMWADHLTNTQITNTQKSGPKIICASVGNPTFPLSPIVASSTANYWQHIFIKSLKASNTYANKNELSEETSEQIITADAAIDYADEPAGDVAPRKAIADFFNETYHTISIKPEQVLFTVGATSGLNAIFKVVNTKNPGGKIITPVPYYWNYLGIDKQNKLHLIDVMKEKGYKLTASALKKSIMEVKKEGSPISAFLFCDPNNPLGTVLSKEEWKEIAIILKKESAPIIIDQSYYGLQFTQQPVCLLEIAPELQDRLLMVYSATKTSSAAGERLAFILAFNESLQMLLQETLVNMYLHAPRSLQVSCAAAFSKQNLYHLKWMNEFYKQKVEYVLKRIAELNLSMPDPHYHVAGTFYVMINCQEFFGLPIPEAAQKALGKSSYKVSSDVDIAFYLLFTDGIALAPLSCFGVNPKLGYLRITCSAPKSTLLELMARLEQRIMAIRALRTSPPTEKNKLPDPEASETSLPTLRSKL